MAIRAVVFDLFDTLVDLSMENLPRVQVRGREVPSTMGALHKAALEGKEITFDDFADALIDVDQRHRKSHYDNHRELSTLERFRILCEQIQLPHSEFAQRLTDVHMGMIHSCASTPAHHVDVMSSLAEKVRLGLCSNFSDSATARRILTESGLGETLHSLVISEDVGIRKPHPGIFEAILKELDVVPEETLHVGDNLTADVIGASGLGIRTVWITRRIADPAGALDQHQGPAPDWQIRDLAELESLIDGG
jgi:putative hydrolase of the HAD superfamily